LDPQKSKNTPSSSLYVGLKIGSDEWREKATFFVPFSMGISSGQYLSGCSSSKEAGLSTVAKAKAIAKIRMT
jgi:hypothetical protein